MKKLIIAGVSSFLVAGVLLLLVTVLLFLTARKVYAVELIVPTGDDYFITMEKGGMFPVASIAGKIAISEPISNGKVSAVKQIKGTKYNVLATHEFKNLKLKTKEDYLTKNSLSGLGTDSAIQSEFKSIKEVDKILEKIQKNFTYSITSKVKLDDIYKEKKSNCFGFSQIVACVLREKDVPCKVVIGYSSKATTSLHSWNEIYINGEWVMYDMTVAVNCKDYLYGYIKNATTDIYFVQ